MQLQGNTYKHTYMYACITYIQICLPTNIHDVHTSRISVFLEFWVYVMSIFPAFPKCQKCTNSGIIEIQNYVKSRIPEIIMLVHN